MSNDMTAQREIGWSAVRAEVLDPASIGSQLGELLSAGPQGQVPSLRSVALLDEKPGQRCTVLYRFVDDVACIGKAFVASERAARLARDHRALWESGVRVPEPLGLIAGGHLAVHRHAPGRPLGELLGSPAGALALADTGRWLAALHGSAARPARSGDRAGEHGKWLRWAEAIDETAHLAHRSARPIAHALQATDRRSRGTAPIHHDLHPDHVLVGAETTVIDLDEVRLGDPAIDLGHLAAYLQLAAWRRDDVAASLAGHLVAVDDGYRSAGGSVEQDAVRWASAAAFLKIAWQLALGLGVRPRPTGPDRQAQLTLALDAAEANLDRLG